MKKHELRYLYVGIFALLLLWVVRFPLSYSQIHIATPKFLVLHSFFGSFSIFVSISIFVQSIVTYSPTSKNENFFFGLLFFAVGSFDFLHTLFYKGMPFFDDEFVVNSATWYWVMARLIESVGVFLVILKSHKFRIEYHKVSVLIMLLSVSIMSTVIFFEQDRLPMLMDSLTGMTTLKVVLEYIICSIMLVTFFILSMKYKKDKNIDTLRLSLAVFIIMVSELFFTFDNYVYDAENLIGHVYKLVGYMYFYRSIFFSQIQLILTDKKEAETKWMEAENMLFEVEKNMSRLVLQMHEEERKRVSRELHDGIGQSLYSILVTLAIADSELTGKNKSESLQRAKRMTADAMVEVKEIAHSLRPSSLDDLGFVPALRTYIENFQKIHGIQVEFEVLGDKQRLDSEIETAFYRICQETLTNSAKYSQAELIRLSINNNEEEIQLMIKDDGIGFSIENYMKDDKRKGIGLFSMNERAEALGGTFKLNSNTNEGTTIIIRIPKIQAPITQRS